MQFCSRLQSVQVVVVLWYRTCLRRQG